MLPSLPGYGFSAEPAEVGWDLVRTARAWSELMHRLGYDRYVAQGGDVGAGVTDAMGRLGREGLVAIHTNLLVPALNGAVALSVVKIPSRKTSCKIEIACSSVAYGIGAKAVLLVVRTSGSRGRAAGLESPDGKSAASTTRDG